MQKPGTSLGLNWECYHSLEMVESDWRALQHTGSCRVFQDFDWVRIWHETIGEPLGVVPWVFVGRHEGFTKAILPLGLANRAKVRRLTWLASDWNDYNSPILASDFSDFGTLNDVWDTLQFFARDVDLVEIPKQVAFDAEYGLVNSRHGSTVREECSTHILDLVADRESLKSRVHSGKTWSGFDRKLRKLEKLGSVEYQLETNGPQRRQIAEELLKQKSKNLKAAGKKDPFGCPLATDFFLRFIVERPELAQLSTLRLDGKPIVITLCLRARDTLLLYQTVYQSEYRSYSPGALLLHRIIFEAAENGYSAFDCLFGDDPYKLQICNRTVALERALIPFSVKGRAAKLATTAKLHLRRTIKQSPKLYGNALRVNRMFAGLAAKGV